MRKHEYKVVEKYKNILTNKGYSNRTVDTYSFYLNEVLVNINNNPYHLNKNELESYLVKKEYSSKSVQNQVISSVKLYCKYILKMKNISFLGIERPRKEKKLPKIIDKDYLLNCIEGIENLKHKAIISLAYSVGLRVSEVINLKIEDIDSKRMVINIKNTKGRKDRVVPLTENILILLRKYFKKFKPNVYLFNGQSSLRYSTTSCNKLVKKYLGESYHFHLLRHATMTHLTDKGVDLRVIQKLAGHSSSKTTEIYTHVSTQLLNTLPLAI